MTSSSEPTSEERLKVPRYPVLDALRFVLALWVTIGHYKVFPLFQGVDTATSLGRFLTRGWDTVVFGTPAVIVFFVISGFCIHLPFRGDKKLQVGRYYLRRYTRILIPVAGALIVYRLAGDKLRFWGEHSILWESPLWSLACEEIYYAAYPVLRILRNKWGWLAILGGSFAASVGVAATHIHSVSWHDFGPVGTSLILLPVWLLGCLLAEQSDSLGVMSSTRRIWAGRFGIWLASWCVEMLHFKAGVPYTQTISLFGVLAYFWVKNEIAYGREHAPNKLFVAAGAWSYSLYLVHAEGLGVIWRLGVPNLGYILEWFLSVCSALGTAYVFYLLVEKPSHQLARKIKLSEGKTVVVAEKTAEAVGGR
jgi:peptidoglycan/LPS O-acetylase OafA/YrhL